MKQIFVIAMIIAAASISFAGQCSEADKNALRDLDMAWGKANVEGDKAALEAIFADDYVGFPTMDGKAVAINAAMTTFERDKANPQMATKTKYDHYMMSCTPVTATITHRNTTWIPGANGGKGTTVYSRSVHFLEKRNGKWVAVSNAGGSLSDADILRYMEMDWINAVKNREMAWFDKNYADNFTEVSFMTGNVMNKQQAIDGLKADKTVFEAMDISDLNIRVDGDTAVVTGIGWAKGKDGDGKAFDMKMRFTDTFIKRDGRWLAWASSATAIPKPAETAKN